MLASFILAGYYNTGWNVGNTDSRFGFIYMLAALAAGAIGVDTQVLLANFHLVFLFHLGQDIQGGERGMAAARRIEGRNAHQTVYPAFRAQIAIGVQALHRKSGAFYARFLAGQAIH